MKKLLTLIIPSILTPILLNNALYFNGSKENLNTNSNSVNNIIFQKNEAKKEFKKNRQNNLSFEDSNPYNYQTTRNNNDSIVSIIFDTDIAEDYDDIGAMAVLYALEDLGEIKVLATISSNAYKTTVASLSVINTYFGKDSIPIGVTKKDFPNRFCKQEWDHAIINKYPNTLKSNEEGIDAVKLYRKILSESPNASITIVTVGFFTNLASLIKSEPDEYSELSGKALIKQKVKLLVSMASKLNQNETSGKEYNIRTDVKSAQIVFDQWNTPMILSPFEVGFKILTGIPLINNELIKNSPIKDAYTIGLKKDNNTKGRMSWDQTAVLVAARGIKPYFNSRKLNMKIDDDGTNVIIPGKRITYLSFRQTPEEISIILEELMAYKP